MKKFVLILLFIFSFALCAGCNLDSPPTTLGLPLNSVDKENVSDKLEKFPISVDKENLSSLLENISRPKTYTWESTITYTSGEQSLIYHAKQYTQDSNVRCEKYDQSGRLLDFSLYLNQILYIVDNSTREYVKQSNYSNTYLDYLIHIADPLILLSSSNLDYISNITLDYYENENIIYFEYYDPDLLFAEKYWVSLNTGIPLKVESNFGQQGGYRMETTSFSEESADASLFQLPSYVRR